MTDRLFVAVVGGRKSGKSTTWNALFGETVRTGSKPHRLTLGKGRSAEAFLVSGSFEERQLYAGDVLDNTDCRIVLCSVQYVKEATSTWDYVFSKGFRIYAQWLNPGNDGDEHWDRLGLVNSLLHHDALVSLRDGRTGADRLSLRVEEIREFITGWANARGLVD
jgi:hypothetical protein